MEDPTMTTQPPSRKTFTRILLTGAAGGLGQILRETLQAHAAVVRSSDISPMAPSRGAHDEVINCNLADKAGVEALVKDVEAIVHLGGISVERPFEEILDANIRGTFHIYEAARKHGIKRVVFASSNHVTGFYPQDAELDARPTCAQHHRHGTSRCCDRGQIHQCHPHRFIGKVIGTHFTIHRFQEVVVAETTTTTAGTAFTFAVIFH